MMSKKIAEILKIIEKHKNSTVILLFILVLLALAPRLWGLKNNPPLVVDEAANVRDINILINLNTFRPQDFEWGFGQATLVHYPAILLINSGVHDEYLALRLTSAILSVLALVPFFLIMRRHTNNFIAFLTTLLFSYSYFFLQFSRVGWTNIHMLTLSMYLLWCTERAVETKKRTWFMLTGLFSGLLIYTYRAGEIIIIATLIYILIKSFQEKIHLKRGLVNIVLVIAIALIISMPWDITIFSHWDQYTLRERVVYVFNAPKPYHGLFDNASILIYQVYAAIKAFVFMLPHISGGIESQRYLPLTFTTISPFLIPLFFLGVFLAIKSFKNTFHWFIIFVLGLVFGQILTVDPPNGSRGIILLPIIYLLIGVAIFSIYKWYEKRKNLKFILIVFSCVVALLDFLYYIYWMTWIKV